MHEMRFDTALGHAASFYKSPLARVYGYDAANDGPECEVITRILAKHPLYVVGMERPAIVVSRCLELVSLLRYKKSFSKLKTDENLAVHRAVAIMLVTHQ